MNCEWWNSFHQNTLHTFYLASTSEAWLNFKQKQSCQTFCSQVAVTGGGRTQIQIGEGFMWSKSKARWADLWAWWPLASHFSMSKRKGGHTLYKVDIQIWGVLKMGIKPWNRQKSCYPDTVQSTTFNKIDHIEHFFAVANITQYFV